MIIPRLDVLPRAVLTTIHKLVQFVPCLEADTDVAWLICPGLGTVCTSSLRRGEGLQARTPFDMGSTHCLLCWFDLHMQDLKHSVARTPIIDCVHLHSISVTLESPVISPYAKRRWEVPNGPIHCPSCPLARRGAGPWAIRHGRRVPPPPSPQQNSATALL